MDNKIKVVVVMPAYNAGATLERTVSEIPRNIVDEIILTDDSSEDDTLAIARKLNLTVFRHEKNEGYGGNQKTCYRHALERGADIVIMIHPDYQYDPKLIQQLIRPIIDGKYDAMLGSRIQGFKKTIAGGMPLYKYLGNRFLTFVENAASGETLKEWHTGMRAYTKEVLNSVDFAGNSNNFVFDTQILFQILGRGFRIGEITVPVRYFKESSSINFSKSAEYGLETLWVAAKYLFSGRNKKR
ncbi:MAG: glycosyltransferase family 2 protein [Candidatus Jorgensenbacteria bacterium]